MRGAPGDEVGGAWNDGSWFHATGIGKTRLWLQRKVRRSGIVSLLAERLGVTAVERFEDFLVRKAVVFDCLAATSKFDDRGLVPGRQG